MVAVSLALRFVLELCLLAALALWGAGAGSGTLTHVVAGIGAPTIAAVVWGVAISPRARRQLPRVWWIALQLGLFALSALALGAAGHRALALVLAAGCAVNLAVLLALGAVGNASR